MKMSSFLLLAIVVTNAISCKKDAETLSTVDLQKVTVSSATWKVSSFIEKGVDQTSDFSAYLFQFKSDGSAVVTGTGTVILFSGTWSLMQGSHSGYDDSGNHTSGDNNKFIINLTGNLPMDKISDDWEIVKLTETEIWIMDDNTTSPKEIHFTKNT